MDDLKFSVAILSVFLAALVLLTSAFPLHEMYTIGTSWEIQELALFIAEGKDISESIFWGTGVQFPAPAQAFVVAFFYSVIRNIDIACLVTNLMFSMLAVFTFKFLSESNRLTFILVFVPFWLSATFTAIPDLAGIFFMLLSLYFFKMGNYPLAIGMSSLFGLFRIEGFGLSLIMLLVSRKPKYAVFPLVSGVAFLSWYQLVFGNPFLMLVSHSSVAVQPGFIASEISAAWHSGVYGIGKVVYTIFLLITSAITVFYSKKRFENNIWFFSSLYLLLIHTIAFPVGIFFEYPRFFLMLAPISLIVFKREIEKWFIPTSLLLVILSSGAVYMFFSKATLGQII